jgi:putative thioredoxin
MLIGMGKKKQDAAAAAKDHTAAPGPIFDVTVEDFETKVVTASMTIPVLVDFWAPWCGPCKQLTPVLEQAVKDAKGKVLLAKINIDDNPELAQALRVQSVPTVYAFFQGQPVTAFAGARPASEIKALIDQLTQLAGEAGGMAAGVDLLDIPAALAQAAALLADNKLPEAQNLYIDILQQEENNAPAYAGLIRTMLASGNLEQAQAMVEDASEPVKADPVFAAARTALELAQKRPDSKALDALKQKLAADETDLQARFDLGAALFANGESEAAIDHMLEIVRRNRSWEEDKARLELLKFLEALGFADPIAAAGRRKLSSILFS